ncbi:helix-turn-helix transcriptional regulator [Streptomyces sp. NPDC088387]|uniref:helix-turn-helix transcriptional regulator n=1 Tax=Streptomyces sp. NPDC088387 TaxID=3365859 RepID=UPI003803F0D0
MGEAVEKAVACIRARFGGPLTVTEIAGSALLSTFHFSRIFKEETGISPGRFLSAVRVDEAKRLLDDTSAGVAEISAAVGYASLGSFTHFFTGSVGLSPGRFRRRTLDTGRPLPGPTPVPDTGPGVGAVAGTVRVPAGFGAARVFVGAFPTALMQHPFAAATVVDVPAGGPVCYRLSEVPPGEWYLLAAAVAAGDGHDPAAGHTALVGGHGIRPVGVTAGAMTSAALRLHPPAPLDAPVLLALPDLTPPTLLAPRPPCVAAPTPPPTIPGALEAAGAGGGVLRPFPATRAGTPPLWSGA